MNAISTKIAQAADQSLLELRFQSENHRENT